jgi:argininosuccinate lyase
LKEYQRRSKAFGKNLYAVLDPAASVKLKRSEGSTSPAEVEKSIRRWEKRL